MKIGYIAVGLLSVVAAFLISLRFIGHSLAQEAPPATPPPAAAETPSPSSEPAPSAEQTPPPAQQPPAEQAPPTDQAPPTAQEPPANQTAPATQPPPTEETPPAAQQPPANAGTQASPPVQAAPEASELEGFLEPFIYDLVNRRDPFQPFSDYVPDGGGGTSNRPLTPAQRFDLDQLRLVGIMWDVKDPRAMFLDPDQQVLVLGRDEGIGNRNGYIAAIREGEVVVVEAQRRRGDIIYKTRVLRIER